MRKRVTSVNRWLQTELPVEESYNVKYSSLLRQNLDEHSSERMKSINIAALVMPQTFMFGCSQIYVVLIVILLS
jgi:hypothetical protein